MKKLPNGFAAPVVLLVVGLLVGAGVVFVYFQFNNSSTSQITSNTLETASQKTENSHTCKLAMDKKYFPPNILNYKLENAQVDNSQAVARYLGDNNNGADFSIRTIEFSKTLSRRAEVVDPKYESLKNDSGYMELLIKSWKGEASQKELDRIIELSGAKGPMRYEEVNGMKVLTGLGGFLYYDPVSQLMLTSYFYDANKHAININYVDYFKDWARQMC